MASTASTLLKFEKQTTGENPSTWGTKANTALSRLEEAIADITNIAVTGANVTLDDTQYTEHVDGSGISESHVSAIVASGTLTGNRTVIVPLRNKHYLVTNNCSGAYTLTVIGATGTGTIIPQGYTLAVRCDGTNIDAAGVAFDTKGLALFEKGGDIASASPTVIDTDGTMFDVTGTTGFSAFTVAAGRIFICQFDGILTMTHGAGTLDLLGAANITTAAGDVGIFYSTAANVVRMVSWIPVVGFVQVGVDNTFTGDQTFGPITETQTVKAASFTPSLTAEGTIYNCNAAITITMPTATAGKGFTIIHDDGTEITWAGTILWAGGAAPTAAAAKEIYVFLSDGTNWYGNLVGTGYA